MVDENQDTITVTIRRRYLITNSTIGTVIIDLGDIPTESVEFNLDYGIGQYLLDGAACTVNEKDEDGKFILDGDGNKIPRPEADVAADKLAGVNARLAAIKSGVFPSGGGGRALSAYDNELRAIVKAVLVNKGIKLADATKAAKSPREAIKALAAKKAKADRLSKEDAQALFTVNWETLTDKATALAAQHKAIDVDL